MKKGKFRKLRRAPAAAVTLLATAELLSVSGPVGAAPPVSPLELFGTAMPTALVVSETLAQPKLKALIDAFPAAQTQEPEVPESAPVEDTYFADTVFLGDSRTEGFRLYSGLKTGTYLCAVGATVESVFTRSDYDAGSGKVSLLDALSGVACGKVYIMLGVNELGWPSTDAFYDQYARVIDRVRELHPQAQVVLQTILPVSAKQDAKGSYVNNSRIAAFNEVVRNLAIEKDCPLVNVSEAVTDENGCLQADLNFDGVHLNPAGCRLWLEYLRTHSVG